MTGLTRAHQVADAVLYEGYLLYPYRASSPKNQVRWQFGVLGPPGAAEAGVGEPATMVTEVALESADVAFIDLYVRFLQVQSRVVERWTERGWQEVDELTVGGTRWIPFHEAVSPGDTAVQHPARCPPNAGRAFGQRTCGGGLRGTVRRLDAGQGGGSAHPPSCRVTWDGHPQQPSRPGPAADRALPGRREQHVVVAW